jgi:mxaK protein
MRRRHVHLLFGAAAATCALVAGFHGWQFAKARELNHAMTNAGATAVTSSRPEAQLARAIAFAHDCNSEAAVELYKELSRGGNARLAEIALYNLGNLYMRQALQLQSSADEAARSLPLLELAKQSYRDALRLHPQNWDARYNLERALWLSPEVDEGPIESRIQVDSEERVRSTLQGTRVELP